VSVDLALDDVVAWRFGSLERKSEGNDAVPHASVTLYDIHQHLNSTKLF
jgi:hypothetical protein